MSRKSFYTFSKTHGFFEPCDVGRIVNDPGVLGIHVQRKARWDRPPVPGSTYAWALGAVEDHFSSIDAAGFAPSTTR